MNADQLAYLMRWRKALIQKTMRATLRLLTVVGLLLAPRLSVAQDITPQRVSLLVLRILAYDRNLVKRADKETVTIALVHKAGDRASESACSEIGKALKRSVRTFAIAGRRVRIVSIPYSTGRAFDASMKESGVVALYGCQGLKPDAETLSKVTRQRSILTFSSEAVYIEKGFSIGLLAGTKRVTIRVNLRASIAEGADLDPVFLRVADVIR